jgi:preprotein translocase subunit SecE
MAAHNSIKKVDKQASSKIGFINFFKELKSEIKRITWASKQDVKKAIATVMIFCLIYMVVVGALDFGFRSLVRVIFK